MFSTSYLRVAILLSQACAGCRPAHAWFLKIVCMRVHAYMCACVCVSPPPRLLITSGVIWTPYDWLNKFYSIYMAAVVGIVSRCGLSTEAC